MTFEPTLEFETVRPLFQAAETAVEADEIDKAIDILDELAARGVRLTWGGGAAEPRPDMEGSLQLRGSEMMFRPDHVRFQDGQPVPPHDAGPSDNVPQPAWSIPDNLLELVDDDEGGIWEDKTWDPILLTVMKGTVYRGRHIPVAWQIEFEPVGPRFQAANEKPAKLGLDADGYGWATLIKTVAETSHPAMAKQLQFGDTEASACVVWVESEAACRQLIEMTWTLIHVKT